MNKIVDVNEVKALVSTDMEDIDIQRVIDRVQHEMELTLGPFQTVGLDQTVTEVQYGGLQKIFLKRKISSVSSVDEDGEALTEDTGFLTWPDIAMLERLPRGSVFGTVVTITYVPIYEAEWKTALIDLVRVEIDKTAFNSESVGQDYRYDAKDWATERRKIMRRLEFTTI